MITKRRPNGPPWGGNSIAGGCRGSSCRIQRTPILKIIMPVQKYIWEDDPSNNMGQDRIGNNEHFQLELEDNW